MAARIDRTLPRSKARSRRRYGRHSPRRRIALKVVHPLYVTSNRLKRFRQEAELLGRLQHPGIAQIYEAGSYDLGRGEQPYFAMEFVEGLDPDLTVWDQIDGAFPTATIGTKRILLGSFDFPGDEIEKPIRVLSGGERSRLVLAQMLFNPPNFLVLDEPTNDLGLATKEMLVETLANFEGTMIFISHDRTFLRRASNRVLDLSGRRQSNSEQAPRVSRH